MQVEEYAALKTWTVLGFYFANEGLGELTPLDPTKIQIPILVKRLQAQAGPDVSFFAVRMIPHPLRSSYYQIYLTLLNFHLIIA